MFPTYQRTSLSWPIYVWYHCTPSTSSITLTKTPQTTMHPYLSRRDIANSGDCEGRGQFGRVGAGDKWVWRGGCCHEWKGKWGERGGRNEGERREETGKETSTTLVTTDVVKKEKRIMRSTKTAVLYSVLGRDIAFRVGIGSVSLVLEHDREEMDLLERNFKLVDVTPPLSIQRLAFGYEKFRENDTVEIWILILPASLPSLNTCNNFPSTRPQFTSIRVERVMLPLGEETVMAGWSRGHFDLCQKPGSTGGPHSFCVADGPGSVVVEGRRVVGLGSGSGSDRSGRVMITLSTSTITVEGASGKMAGMWMDTLGLVERQEERMAELDHEGSFGRAVIMGYRHYDSFVRDVSMPLCFMLTSPLILTFITQRHEIITTAGSVKRRFLSLTRSEGKAVASVGVQQGERGCE
ncbi:hypothetical protein BJ165DRAFT_1598375 [Panaeolus papilionaceus]|nr:hypothetical protein BJ165DRAFT_1598375 [Panaeolus papilionaceus]